jgi:heavy metal sensor kinase
MRSIRWSLVVYFLVLLGLALGAVSVSAYEYTRRVLRLKQLARQELLETNYTNDCKRERESLNRILVRRARTLADQARFQYQANKFRIFGRSLDMAPLGMLSIASDPYGYALAPIWLSARHQGPLHEWMHSILTEIQFDEEILSESTENQLAEYYQINLDRYRVWHSRSMGEHSFSFNSTQFSTTPQWADVELEPGVQLRLVRLKAPVANFVYPPGPPPRNKPGPPVDSLSGPPPDFSRRLPPPSAGPRERPAPAIYIQCAAETTQRDAALAQHRIKLDNELAKLQAESDATLAGLRNLMLAISLTTFVATVAGGFWLVRLGLSPLRRLSEAVSRVSAKDFRLPFDAPRLPQELKPIVDRLTQTLDLLKRTFAREKQAAADISHELRTPLAALLTTIEVALRKPRSQEEYQEILADCHATGQQMSQLVERLLVLARLDAGVDTLRPREFDVATLTEQCTTLVRPLADARGLALEVKRNGPTPIVSDPDKLREVLTNLLHNAIEYNRPDGKVEVSVAQQNGHLQVEVRDTGIGIAPEARGHIFERFYRADPSRRAEGLHAGLGLAIVKGYVDLMGGTISVDSSVGQGSVFRLQLPIQKTMASHRSLEER